jgi:Cell division protein CrgA
MAALDETRPVAAVSPWLGGASLVVFTFGAFWLLSFGLLDIDGQVALGAWNFVVSVPAMIGGIVLLRWWRPDPARPVRS